MKTREEMKMHLMRPILESVEEVPRRALMRGAMVDWFWLGPV